VFRASCDVSHGTSAGERKKQTGNTIMLIQAKTLKGFKLGSLDGNIGGVSDFYFDDHRWVIRYLVADTGGWLTGRSVLISPYALIAAHKDQGNIEINLTKDQIKNSPSPDCDKPVSRQFEKEYNGYYGWPSYWGGPSTWGAYPMPVSDPQLYVSDIIDSTESHDPHLRSTDEVTGYHLQASDGEIGHVVDFIIDDQTWAIRYLVVDTNNWWPSKNILVSPGWIKRVSWTDEKVFVDLTRDAIKAAPAYKSDELISRSYENSLFQHYGASDYWSLELEEQSTR
jgi:uncharacterized protein YrrD